MSAKGAIPSAQVRQMFLDFFAQRHNHVIVKSSPVVPHDDPTILFANAGMNQFKPIFLGDFDPNTQFGKWHQAGRLANSQKCIRAGGKHNDLEDVGLDTYHHTFFEMLGNWSFASYFKVEAIAMAWELLTSPEWYALPKDRFYATYFEGNPELGVPPDLVARDTWKQYLPEDHILPGNMKDNFWEMGDVGPCGPCSELHYDRIGGRNAAHLVNKDDPMVLEVWNIVFMQFVKEIKDGPLLPLAHNHVDAGMGFERLVSVIHNVTSNYDTDIWHPIFEQIRVVTGCPVPYAGGDDTGEISVAYRVVADHIRTLVVACCDGASPDKEGRCYVLRRIARRAIRMGREFLCPPGSYRGEFLTSLVPAVVDSLGPHFTELTAPGVADQIMSVLAAEEQAFGRTWNRGMGHFNVAAQAAKNSVICGRDAFILHDRYGFPIDLTCLIASRRQLQVDMKAFDEALAEQRSRAGRKDARAAFPFAQQHIDQLQGMSLPPTDDMPKFVWSPASGDVVAIFVAGATASVSNFVDSLSVESSESLDCNSVAVILSSTGFYAEGGGQVTDVGDLTWEGRDGSTGGVFEVTSVIRKGPYVLHLGNFSKGSLMVGDRVSCQVDYIRRHPIAINHTMTHALNFVLRDVLLLHPVPEEKAPVPIGAKLDQKGSSVTEDELRFDYSWGKRLEPYHYRAVEAGLTKLVQDDTRVFTRELPANVALSITGIRAMFGEKYGAEVRVVSIGADFDAILADPTAEKWMDFSIELCGGTHLDSLASAQRAVIVEDGSIASGIRRMRILTSTAADESIGRMAQLQRDLDAILSMKSDTPALRGKKIKQLQHRLHTGDYPLIQAGEFQERLAAEIKAVEKAKKGDAAAMKLAATRVGESILAAEPGAKHYTFNISAKDETLTPPLPRDVAFAAATALRGSDPNVPVFIMSNDDEKAAIICFVPKGSPFTAPEWVQAAVGRGGGRPEEAQGGCTAAQGADILQKAIDFANSKF